MNNSSGLLRPMVKVNTLARLILNAVLLGFLLIGLAHAEAGANDLLNPDERNWLASNQDRLVLAIETGYAPFVFINPKDQPTGLAHDYLRLVESKLGVEFKQRRFSSLSDIFEKVKSGEVQIVNAVTSTPSRATFLLMTDAFVSVPNVIIVRKEHPDQITANQLSGLRVSLVKSYAVTEHLLNHDLHFIPDLVADDLTALLNVAFGHCDAAVIDLATASYLISEKGITNLRVASDVGFDIRLSIATPLNEPILHSILQKGLNAITAAEREQRKNRWINTSSQNIYHYRQFWIVLGGVLAVVFVSFAGILIWNRTLRRQVAIRTQDLVMEKEALKASQAENLALVSRYNKELQRQIAERTAELSAANRKLLELSEMDGLTGIANRRKFDNEFDIAWRRAIREQQHLSLMMLDIDHFKEYNDQYGHQQGDGCLQLVAKTLGSVIQRAGDLVARYGGEEFVVILPGAGIHAATAIAEKLRLAVENERMPHVDNPPLSKLTISIGVASIVPDPDELPTTLLRQADANLYRAKHEGRNRVVAG